MAVNKVARGDGLVLIDLSTDTVTSAYDIVAGKVGHLANGAIVTGLGSETLDFTDISASGDGNVTIEGTSGGSATEHEIYLEFSDNTNTTISVYYDDAFIGTIITASAPATYGGKTVNVASLDGVTWYEKPTGTWEILYPTTSTQFIPNGEGEDGSYCWISQLGDTPFVVGDQYRITYDGTSYEVTAHASAQYGAVIGDESWVDTPIWLVCMYDAWIGSIETKAEASHLLQVEHFVLD